MAESEIVSDIDQEPQVGLEPASKTEQFLTFLMAGEEYGVDILSVQEIRGWDGATSIPRAPHYVKGVINLRGTIVPIIDLRLRFELEPLAYSPLTVVIVLKVPLTRGHRVVGIVVDAVSDVYDLDLSLLKESPSMGEKANNQFLKGLVSVDDKMIILLDLVKLLDLSEENDLSF